MTVALPSRAERPAWYHRAVSKAAPEVLPSNLAASATRFIGRERELGELDDAVAESRLVTVVGPPGVGKTRLVREYGLLRVQDLAKRFPGGVWFCELGDALGAEGVRAAVAAVFGASLGAADLPKLWSRLGRTLLVLDDFDQLVGLAEETVGEWLKHAVGLRVVVTSRERLRIEGERVFDLRPLDLEVDAVELFVDRATAASATAAAWGPAQRAAVVSLVAALDGLPLAIELAAARTRVLAPTQILLDLPRHPEILSGESIVTAGGRTLLAALEASYRLLGPTERAVLAQCSIFSGGFDWPAAERVVEVEPGQGEASILDALQVLRDRSLVSTMTADGLEGELRFSLLVSVRLFAASQLDEASRIRAHRAHAAYYLERWGSPGVDHRDRRRLSLDRDNLLAVHERAVADGRADDALRASLALAQLSASLSYGWSLRLVNQALALREEGESCRLEGWALETRGNLLRFLGRAADGSMDLERARLIGERSGDRALTARALTGLGNGAAVLARWATARNAFEQAIEILAKNGDRFAEGRAHTMLAACLYNEDRFDDASRELESALSFQRQESDRTFEAMSVTSMGIVELARGSFLVARAHFDEALALYRDTPDRHWEAVTIGYLAMLDLDLGEVDKAKSGLDAAAATLGELGVRRAEAIVLGHLGHLAVERGALDEALVHYRAALAWHRQTSPDYEGLILGAIGAVSGLRGDLAAAEASLERSKQALAPFARPTFVSALDLFAGLIEVGGALGAMADGRADEASKRESRARAILEGQRSHGNLSSPDTRAAERMLSRALDRLDASRKSDLAARDPAALVVDPNGKWFRAPGATELVRLQSRKSLQRMLRAFIERRTAGSTDPLTVIELLESGWPGERVLVEAGQERVYTAVATLRRLGLRKVLVRSDAGYALDPAVTFVCSPIEPA